MVFKTNYHFHTIINYYCYYCCYYCINHQQRYFYLFLKNYVFDFDFLVEEPMSDFNFSKYYLIKLGSPDLIVTTTYIFIARGFIHETTQQRSPINKNNSIHFISVNYKNK